MSEPIPVILDTDLGDDIDDTWALGMLLGLPEVRLDMVVAAADDTPTKARLIARILDAMGRPDIPVAIGPKTSDGLLHQREWIGDYQLSSYPGSVYEDGIAAVVERIHQLPAPVTVCAIGPLTNLRAMLELDPSIADKVRVVSMAGSIYTEHRGKPGRIAEWNVQKDIPAAQAVFNAPWPITLAPLDGCGDIWLRGERFERVASSSHPRARTVMDNYNAWAFREQYASDSSSVLFDTAAVWLCFAQLPGEASAPERDCFDMQSVTLHVNDLGETIPCAEGRPAWCAMGYSGRDAFEEALVRSLTED